MKISVITATWNSEFAIQSCIDSVASQSYPNIEHVVIDGDSSDLTVKIINSNLDHIDVFLSEPDRGIYDALNKGIAISSGEVIGFLHSDDVYAHVDVISNIATVFEDPSVCAVYGNLQYSQRDDIKKIVRVWKSSVFNRNKLKRGWMPPHPTLYVRREIYEKINFFNINYRISADYLSILQIFSLPNFKSVYLPETLVVMRLGGVSNKSILSVLNKSNEDFRALRSCNFSRLNSFIALLWKNLSKVNQFFVKH
jgi:glycosyltransferase